MTRASSTSASRSWPPRSSPDASLQHAIVEPGLDQVVLERALVLEILLGLAAVDLVERRLRDIDMAARRSARASGGRRRSAAACGYGAVDVGVGHDDDLVVAQLVEVEFLAADAGAQRGDQGADLSLTTASCRSARARR